MPAPDEPPDDPPEEAVADPYDPPVLSAREAAGRERARRNHAWTAVTDATLAAYADAAGTMAA